MVTKRTLVLLLVATTLAVVCAVYLTPLKHINIIAPTIDDVDPSVFWGEYQNNPDKFVFIDVRASSAYRTAHAPGSENVPIPDLFDRYHDLPKSGKEIILICTGGRESGVAYGFLEHQGFLNLKRVDGGLQRWVTQGLPMEGNSIEE